jgi:hypothetical protein
VLCVSLCLQEKKPAAFGWDAFNQQAVFNAAERRSSKVKPDLEAYKWVLGPNSVLHCTGFGWSKGLVTPTLSFISGCWGCGCGLSHAV